MADPYPCSSCPHSRGQHIAVGCIRCSCRVSRAQLLGEGLREGEQRRDTGTTQVLDAGSSMEWADRARTWMADLQPGHRFTSVDLVDSIGMPPSPNAVGAVMRGQGAAQVIRHSGVWVKSQRPERHAAAVGVWVRL